MAEIQNNFNLRVKFTESIEKLENYVNDFEKLVNHQEFYLDNYVFEIKNKIDIQREELIGRIHKISAEMISRMDLFYEECIQNLPNLEELTEKIRVRLASFKNDLNEMKNELKSDHIDQEKIDEIEENLNENKKYIFEYENELRLNQNCFFKPIKHEFTTDFFGELCFKRTDYKDCTIKVVKSFNDPVSKELDPVMDVYEDYKLAIGNSLIRGIEISIFNIHSAECIKTLTDCHNDMISSLKWLTKNELISGSCDNTLKIWNVNSGECLRVLIGHEESVTSLACFKNFIFSSSSDGKIKIWETENFDCIKTLHEENEEPKTILVSSKGHIIALYDERIKIFDAFDNYKCIILIKQENIISIELMKNDNIICCANFAFKLYDITTGECLKYISLFYSEERDFVYGYFLRLLSDKTLVVVYDFITENADHTNIGIKIYDLQNGELLIESERIEGLELVENIKALNSNKLLILNSNQIEDTEENIYETYNQIKIVEIN